MSAALEQAQRIYAAIGVRDLDAIVRELHPDVVIEDETLPDAGTYRGHDGFRQWEALWAASWESYEFRDLETTEFGERVLALFTVVARGLGSGIGMEGAHAIVSAYRDGLVSHLEYFVDQEQARRAAMEPVTASE